MSDQNVSGLEAAQREFADISRSLLSSYAALSERAEHVEQELSRTNEELGRKVEELDRVTRNLEAILSALPTGVVVRDSSGSILRVNPAAERILGATAAELLGERDHPLLEGPTANGAARPVTRSDGMKLVIASRYSDVAPADGQNTGDTGSVEILDDRTEIAILTERLHTMDKVSALGTVASGIAHEIRNPLNAVQGFATLLGRELEPGTETARWAGLIVEGAKEANAIVSSLLCMARPESLAIEPIDPEDLLDQAVKAALPVGPSGEPAADAWRIAVRSTAPPFTGDRIKLRQAIRNLVANAIDIQPGGGAIEVEQFEDDGHIVVRVGDAGPGIPEEIRSKVTDPFFTTRADGTGLGLALASTIAQVHGGRVEIAPVPSSLGGAELSIRFPFSPVS